MADFESEAPFKGSDWNKKGPKKPKGMKKKDWEASQAAAAQKQEDDVGVAPEGNANGAQNQKPENKKKQGGENFKVFGKL